MLITVDDLARAMDHRHHGKIYTRNSSAYEIHTDGTKRSALMKINGLLNKTSTIGYYPDVGAEVSPSPLRDFTILLPILETRKFPRSTIPKNTQKNALREICVQRSPKILTIIIDSTQAQNPTPNPLKKESSVCRYNRHPRIKESTKIASRKKTPTIPCSVAVRR